MAGLVFIALGAMLLVDHAWASGGFSVVIGFFMMLVER